MNENQSGSYHSRFCAVRNKRESIYFLVACLLLTLYGWRNLGKAYPIGQSLFILLLGHLTALALLTQLMVVLKCFRERLVLGLIMATSAIGLIRGLLPSLTAAATPLVRESCFFLWAASSLVSLTMLLSAYNSKGANAPSPGTGAGSHGQ
jgi:hypothetical protein